MSGNEYSEQIVDAWHALGRPTLKDLMATDNDTEPWGKPPAHCNECGRFTQETDLRQVSGTMLEACSACRARRREALRDHLR